MARTSSLVWRRASERDLVRELVVFAVVAGVLFLAPMFLPEFRLNQLGKFLAFAIVAIGIDLLWGYTGMLSLGQGVFFGLGGYAMAMYLKLESSGDELPDFMSWSGLDSLPWFWEPFRHAWFALPAALLGPAVVAFAFGYLLFRSQITGVYFSIVTQALALILSTFLVGQQAYTGGTNGLTNYFSLFGSSLSSASTQRTLYFATVIVLGLTYAFARFVTASRFGRLMVAVRDDEERVRFSGYNVALIKAIVFAVAAAMAGVAGALFVPQVGIISPANLGIVPSIEMVLWVAIGGRGTLFGAVAGAVLIGWARSYFSETYPESWLYLFGGLFIGSVLLFPQGVVGVPAQIRRALKTRGEASRVGPLAPDAGSPASEVTPGGLP